MAWQQIQPFRVALAIGLLPGLERERGYSGKLPAGSRSFALLSVAGAVAPHHRGDTLLSASVQTSITTSKA